MSKSETPRTDEIHSEKDKEFRDNLTQYRFMHDHAETLERELAAVTEQRDRLAKALWNMLNQEHGSAVKAGILLRSLNLQYLNPNAEVRHGAKDADLD
jgi:hypothetical protein